MRWRVADFETDDVLRHFESLDGAPIAQFVGVDKSLELWPEGGHGDRGINAARFIAAFMPRKPLDALEGANAQGSCRGWGFYIPGGCLTASAGSGAEPQDRVVCAALARLSSMIRQHLMRGAYPPQPSPYVNIGTSNRLTALSYRRAGSRRAFCAVNRHSTGRASGIALANVGLVILEMLAQTPDSRLRRAVLLGTPLSGQLPRATIDCGAENAGTALALDHAMAVANTWRPIPRGPRLRQQLAEAQAKRDFAVQRVRRATFTVRRRVSSGLRIGNGVAVRSDRPAQPALTVSRQPPSAVPALVLRCSAVRRVSASCAPRFRAGYARSRGVWPAEYPI